MAFTATRVSVTSSSAVIVTEGAGGQGAGDVGQTGAVIKNKGASSVYLGASGVTDSTGFELANGETVTVSEMGYDEVLYARCASGQTATLHVLKQL